MAHLCLRVRENMTIKHRSSLYEYLYNDQRNAQVFNLFIY
jgi:hypothetical protein